MKTEPKICLDHPHNEWCEYLCKPGVEKEEELCLAHSKEGIAFMPHSPCGGSKPQPSEVEVEKKECGECEYRTKNGKCSIRSCINPQPSKVEKKEFGATVHDATGKEICTCKEHNRCKYERCSCCCQPRECEHCGDVRDAHCGHQYWCIKNYHSENPTKYTDTPQPSKCEHEWMMGQTICKKCYSWNPLCKPSSELPEIEELEITGGLKKKEEVGQILDMYLNKINELVRGYTALRALNKKNQ